MKTQTKIFTGSGSAIANYQAPKERQIFEASALDFAKFNKSNPKHMAILSLCRQIQWVIPHERHGEVADLERLGNWLKTKAPVNKALLDMNPKELSKTITAMEGVLGSTFKKRR